MSLLVLGVTRALAADPSPTIDIGSNKQLFLDDKFFASKRDVTLRMNPPVKAGPAITHTKPWEQGWIYASATFMEDGGVFKAWYTAQPPFTTPGETPALLCYAESKDAVHWDKPTLGIYEYAGSKANNILLPVTLESSSVFIDPAAPPAQRYKLLVIMNPSVNPHDGIGLYVYTSPDGLRWTLHPKLLFPFIPDTVNQAFYDERIKKYVAYIRAWNPQRKVGRVEMDDILQPWPYDKSVVPDARWAGGTPSPGKEVPLAFGYDDRDPAGFDHYNPGFSLYPWAQDAYFMFPAAYLYFPGPPKGRWGNDGPIDIQMAVSRDGVTYQRVSRQPYVELGLKGSRDAGTLYMTGGMLRVGDEIHQFYGGYPYTHGFVEPEPKLALRNGTLFRVVQRLDGFVSVDADLPGGEFATPPLTIDGRRLVLNVNASATGQLLAELRDEAGAPLKGFTFADCDPVHGNDTAHTVTWAGKSDLSAAARTLRLAIRMRAAKLYAVQFAK